MTKETLEIQEIEKKETAAKKPYTRVKTDKGWYSCFNEKASETLEKSKGKKVDVEIKTVGKFNNISLVYTNTDEEIQTEKPGNNNETNELLRQILAELKALNK